MTDPFDALETALTRKRSGWHWQTNPNTGATAIFPTQAKDVGAWEASALACMKAQTTILPAAKPAPQSLVRGRRPMQVVDDPVPRFEDMPESERRRLLADGRRKSGLGRSD